MMMRLRQSKPMKKNKTALEAALHLLGYRAQSEKELRRKLRQRGFSGSDIDNVVEELYRCEYLNDEELAAEIFENYRRDGLYGNRYIKQKLQMRGLSCEDFLTPEEEEEKAELALQRKEASVPGYRSDYPRAAAFLARRGFSYDVIRHVLSHWEE